MQNQPEKTTAAAKPAEKKSDGVAAMLFMSTVIAAVGGASIMFNAAVDKMQDNDPVLVSMTAQQRIEDMGYSNVRFQTFNKAAEKPAHLTFTAEKYFPEGTLAYEGEANCTARSCPQISVKLAGSKFSS